MFPHSIDTTVLSREPDIRGSVQDLYRLNVDGRSCLLCQTSDSGSVFDVGTIFTVAGSDIYRTAIRHHIYSALSDPETWRALDESALRLCINNDHIIRDLLSNDFFDELKQTGIDTHHLGMVDGNTGEVYARNMPLTPSNLVLIEEFPVIRPKRFCLWGRYGWDYHQYFIEQKKVIALENVFRLGCPGGSSLLQRYSDALSEGGPKRAEAFLSTTGLTEAPMPWHRFSDMIFDSATKYEPEDRHLSWQESIHLSGVTGDHYERAIRMLTYCTLYVNHMFDQLGFNLWDIKWEIAVDGDRLVIVDTIDPDSIRVTSNIEYNGRTCFIHFNKQAVRDYYRIIHQDWYNSINEAKRRARVDESGRDFLSIYREGVDSGRYLGIPEYDEEFARIQSRKYAVMVEPLLTNNKHSANMDEINDIMRQEIELYKHADKLDKFLEENSINN